MKKHTNKLLKQEETMITRKAIYWITNTFQKHYKLIAIDQSQKQIELENSDLKQEIHFIERLERNEGVTMFFITEKSEETTSEFTQNAASFV